MSGDYADLRALSEAALDGTPWSVADFQIAAGPARILALLADLDAARREIEWRVDQSGRAFSAMTAARAERDALAVKVERLRSLADTIEAELREFRDAQRQSLAAYNYPAETVVDRIRRALDGTP